MKRLFIIVTGAFLLAVLFAPYISFAQTSRPTPLALGVWGTNAAPVTTDSLVASGDADTTAGRVVTLEPAFRFGGNATLVVNYDWNSGTWPTVTIEARKYYPDFDADSDAADDSLEFGAWFTVGTQTTKPTAGTTAAPAYLFEYNLSSLTEWYYMLGYQLRFRAASGTYNIDLTARVYHK